MEYGRSGSQRRREEGRSKQIKAALHAALGLLGFAVGILALRPSIVDDGLDVTIALRLLAGWSFIASGLASWARRPGNRSGPLLVAIGFLWFAGDLLGQSSWPLVATMGVVFENAWMAAFVVLLVAHPAGRIGSALDRFLVASVFLPAIPMQVAWLLFLPVDGNALLVWPNADVATAIDDAQRIVFLVAVAILPVVLARRWLRASAPLRRVLTPVVVGGVAVVLSGWAASPANSRARTPFATRVAPRRRPLRS